MDIEERMLSELQTTINAIKFIADNKLSSFESDTIVTYDVQRKFVESVTGKHIAIEGWVARFTD